MISHITPTIMYKVLTFVRDFADEFPNTQVIGIDISPIQPDWVPPNLEL